MTPSRRSVLRTLGVAAAAAGGACAGCSQPGGSRVGGGSTATVPVSEVPVGSAYIPPTGRFLVTQPTEGEFRAFVKACPHVGCDVAQVEGEHVICPCHGSTFGLDGSLVKGPAERGLSPATVIVDGDHLQISP